MATLGKKITLHVFCMRIPQHLLKIAKRSFIWQQLEKGYRYIFVFLVVALKRAGWFVGSIGVNLSLELNGNNWPILFAISSSGPVSSELFNANKTKKRVQQGQEGGN